MNTAPDSSKLTPVHARRGMRDWVELMAKDHGVLRLWWHNLHQIDKNMWRSNQPTPRRIEHAAQLGIRTIINLRGPRSDGGWRLEAEACVRHGLELVDFTVRSRAAPDKQMLFDTKALSDSIEGPALLHCKSGADRAGLMSALYLLMQKNRPVAEASQQLSFRYLHVKQAKTGLLDAFLTAYAPYEAEKIAFFDWVKDIYDPEKLQAEFLSSFWADRLVDKLLKRE